MIAQRKLKVVALVVLIFFVAFTPINLLTQVAKGDVNPTIFFDGFESGDFSAWDDSGAGFGGYAPIVQTGNVKSGAYAVEQKIYQETNGYSYLYKYISPRSTVYGRTYIAFANWLDINSWIGSGVILYAGASLNFLVSISRTNTLDEYRWQIRDMETSGLLVESGYFTLEVYRYYCIEMKAVVSPSNGEVRLWVDGIDTASVAGLNTGTTDITIVGVEAWAKDFAQSSEVIVYFDDAAISENYIGPSTPYYFGQDTIVGNTVWFGPSDVQVASQYILLYDTNVASLHSAIAFWGTYEAAMAIYTDNLGRPYSLIGASDWGIFADTTNTPFWHNFTVFPNLSLEAGTYWIVLIFNYSLEYAVAIDGGVGYGTAYNSSLTIDHFDPWIDPWIASSTGIGVPLAFYALTTGPINTVAVHETTSQVYGGINTVFSALWFPQANQEMSKYIFSTNNTGTWTNDTVTAFSGGMLLQGVHVVWSNVTKVLSTVPYVKVGWKIYANTTSDVWAVSDLKVVVSQPIYMSYNQNAVWIMNQGWTGLNQWSLFTDLADVVNNCANNNITYAFVFVGYIYANNSIVHVMNSSFTTTVINAFHAEGVLVLAWAMNGENIDVRESNRANLYSMITNLMAEGFDGYHDDVEGWIGTNQDWIDYTNNATVVLHGLGKLMTTAVAYDWTQSFNHRLHVDYIVTMFYSDRSAFEDFWWEAYWQENFGMYQRTPEQYTPPSSKMMIGIMNYYRNIYSLTWQLQRLTYLLSRYYHENLWGFSIWMYEYMDTRLDDWENWNYWINRVGTITPPVFYNVTINSIPEDVSVRSTTGEYYGYRWTPEFGNEFNYTFTESALNPNVQCYFPINPNHVITAAENGTLDTHHVLIGTTNHLGFPEGYSNYAFSSGPYTVSNTLTIRGVYMYATETGNAKVAIYNSRNYHIEGWLGTDEHPYQLITNGSAAITKDAWALINVAPAIMVASGIYFIVVKVDTAMAISTSSEIPPTYGYGQFFAIDYTAPWDAILPEPDGAMQNYISVYIPSAPLETTLYYFHYWVDTLSDNATRPITVTSDMTLTARYFRVPKGQTEEPENGNGDESPINLLSLLLRLSSIIVPFFAIAYMFTRIKSAETPKKRMAAGFLTLVVSLLMVIVFFTIWYLGIALESL